jgi:hypothetical protein
MRMGTGRSGAAGLEVKVDAGVLVLRKGIGDIVEVCAVSRAGVRP